MLLFFESIANECALKVAHAEAIKMSPFCQVSSQVFHLRGYACGKKGRSSLPWYFFKILKEKQIVGEIARLSH